LQDGDVSIGNGQRVRLAATHDWIPLFELLEARGFEVFLVDPRQSRPGRPKSDVLDCQWLQRLHSYGLLTASFRPADQVVVLRSYLRQRQMLIRYAGQHIQHMQKALEQMNVKLTEVVSNITGVTGMAILRAILQGQRDPLELAKLRNDKCRRTEAEIARALYGNWPGAVGAAAYAPAVDLCRRTLMLRTQRHRTAPHR
jgi:transposase